MNYLLQWLNCLMYIRDNVPFSYYCFFMCSIPITNTGLVLMQFVSYVQLLTDRMKLLNKSLTEFSEYLDKKEGTICDADGTLLCKSDLAYIMPVKKLNFGIDFKVSQKIKVNAMTKLRSLMPVPKKVHSAHLITIQYRNDDFSREILDIQTIYTELEKYAVLINSSFAIQIIVIILIKFGTLTTLLYFYCMIVIK